MDSDQRNDPMAPSDRERRPVKSAGRRRLLQAGIGAAPVVLTFVSRPVPAAPVACTSASATVSANASRVNLQQCVGNGPTAWKGTTPKTQWNATALSGGTPVLFSGVFGSPAYSVPGHASPNLMEVLQGTGGTAKDLLARNLTAAYLNFLSNSTPVTVLSLTQMQAMWSQGNSGVYYPITGGPAWGSGNINVWIATTFATP